MNFAKSIWVYLKDGFYLVFKHPAETEIRIQQYEQEKKGAEETALNFKSYYSLKRFHSKIRMFFFSLFTTGLLAFIVISISIVLILNLFYWILGVENNPFQLQRIISWFLKFHI